MCMHCVCVCVTMRRAGSQFWHGINDKWTVSLRFFFFILDFIPAFKIISTLVIFILIKSNSLSAFLSSYSLKRVTKWNLTKIEGDCKLNLTLKRHHKSQNVVTNEQTRLWRIRSLLPLKHYCTPLSGFFQWKVCREKGIIFTYRLQARAKQTAKHSIEVMLSI